MGHSSAECPQGVSGRDEGDGNEVLFPSGSSGNTGMQGAGRPPGESAPNVQQEGTVMRLRSRTPHSLSPHPHPLLQTSRYLLFTKDLLRHTETTGPKCQSPSSGFFCMSLEDLKKQDFLVLRLRVRTLPSGSTAETCTGARASGGKPAAPGPEEELACVPVSPTLRDLRRLGWCCQCSPGR